MDDRLESAKYYADELVSSGEVFDDRETWINDIIIPLSSLGEQGRELVHKVSRSSSKYDAADTDKKFDEIAGKKYDKGIKAFFNFCHKKLKISAPGYSNNGPITQGSSNKFSQNGNSNKNNNNFRQQNDFVPLDQDPVLKGDKIIKDIDDIMEAPDVEFISHFFVKNSNNAIVASSEAGKTTLMSNLAFAIAKGWEKFLGYDINARKMAVLIVSTEDGISSYKGRFKKLKRKYGLPEKSSIRFIFDNYRVKEKIEYALEQKPCDLIIIDTWGDFVGGEYVGDKTRPMMNEIKMICNKYDGTPVYVHHTNKMSENIPDKSSIKGAGDFEQANRSVIMLNIFEGSRWLSIVKLNEFTDDQKRYSYKIYYDEETGMVSRSEDFMERIEIVKALRSDAHTSNKKPDAKFDEILKVGEFVEYKDLVLKVKNACDVQERAAKDRIAKALEKQELHKFDNGTYSLTAF